MTDIRVDSLQNEVHGIQTQIGMLAARLDNWTTDFQDKANLAITQLDQIGIDRGVEIAQRGDAQLANMTEQLRVKFAELESQLVAKFSEIENKMQSPTTSSSGGAAPQAPTVNLRTGNAGRWPA